VEWEGGARSAACPGGSRARAMLTRQPDCEVEIVPSLHSNLAGAVPATGAVFSSAAACWGAGACAAGFSDANQAQPAHKERSIQQCRSAFGELPEHRSGRCGWFRATTRLAAYELRQHTTAGHDSNMKGANFAAHPDSINARCGRLSFSARAHFGFSGCFGWFEFDSRSEPEICRFRRLLNSISSCGFWRI
jgi:hypothetical protein